MGHTYEEDLLNSSLKYYYQPASSAENANDKIFCTAITLFISALFNDAVSVSDD
jgi:hypothetical protein